MDKMPYRRPELVQLSMTDELINFLRARLDAAADREARRFRDTWRFGDPCVECERPAESMTHWSSGPPVAKFEPCGHEIADYSQLSRYSEPAGDPFTLADVEAKRRILSLHSDATGHSCSITDETGYELNYAEVAGDEACTTLRLLTLPYSEHPDYRQEWRP